MESKSALSGQQSAAAPSSSSTLSLSQSQQQESLSQVSHAAHASAFSAPPDITEFTAEQACELYEGKIERKSEQELLLTQLGECLAEIGKHVRDPQKCEECIYFPTDFSRGMQLMTAISPLTAVAGERGSGGGGGGGAGGMTSGSHIERLHRRLILAFETQLREVFGFHVEAQLRVIKVSWLSAMVSATSDGGASSSKTTASAGAAPQQTRPLVLNVNKIKLNAAARTKAIVSECPDLAKLQAIVEVFGAEDALAKQIDARQSRRDDLFHGLRAESLRVLREAATHHRNSVSMSPLSSHMGQGRLTSADRMLLFDRLIADLEERSFTVTSISNAPQYTFTASFSRPAVVIVDESSNAEIKSAASDGLLLGACAGAGACTPSIASIMAKRAKHDAEEQLKAYTRLIGELTNVMRQTGNNQPLSAAEAEQVKRVKGQSFALYQEILSKMLQ